MIDLVEYQTYIGRKTRFGDRPGPDPWYHTRKLLATYAPKPNLDDIIQMFEKLGAKTEIEAAMFVGVNMTHIP
jgi:hypothetical protein